MNYSSMCQEITDRIIKEMENGIIPWEKPWFGVRGGAIKYSDGKPYSFLNQLLIGDEGEWIGYSACKSAGGYCVAGKSRTIYKYQPDVFGTDKDTGETILIKKGFFVKLLVWKIGEGAMNVKRRWEEQLPVTMLSPDKFAEEVVDTYLSNNKELSIYRDNASNRAFYRPSTDSITVPKIEQFDKLAEYYSTLFHEMTHSTGAKHRLDRLNDEEQVAFGSESYSKEELVAEIGGASLVNYCGLESVSSFRNSTAYIQSWLSKLRNDPKLIIEACKASEKALNYIIKNEKGEN